MTAATARRPVRVTIDGEAYSPADGVLIVVRKDGGKIVFPAKAEGVTVEDTLPPRVWTDGDVVQHVDGNYTAQRIATDKWRTTESGAGSKWNDDAAVSELVDAGRLIVLRYQHGGDQ